MDWPHSRLPRGEFQKSGKMLFKSSKPYPSNYVTVNATRIILWLQIKEICPRLFHTPRSGRGGEWQSHHNHTVINSSRTLQETAPPAALVMTTANYEFGCLSQELSIHLIPLTCGLTGKVAWPNPNFPRRT